MSCPSACIHYVQTPNRMSSRRSVSAYCLITRHWLGANELLLDEPEPLPVQSGRLTDCLLATVRAAAGSGRHAQHEW
jgi:hypothetical protein